MRSPECPKTDNLYNIVKLHYTAIAKIRFFPRVAFQ